MYSPATGWEEKLSKLILPEIPQDISLKKIVLAISGGQDSVLGLYGILAISKQITLEELHLFFLDHGFFSHEIEKKRKEILEQHVQFAKSYLGENKIFFHAYKRDIPKIAIKLKTSKERAGSLLRHRLLQRICPEGGYIATGHNLSDWLETVVLRLNRGSSPSAIYPFATVERQGSFSYFYPIAHLTRLEVQKLLAELKIPFWQDPQNEDKSNRRSQMREVLSFHAAGLRRSRQNFLLEKEKNQMKINIIPTTLIEICQNRKDIANFTKREFNFYEIKKKESCFFPILSLA